MQGLTIPPQGVHPETPPAHISSQPSAVTPADLRKMLFKRKWIILLSVLAGIAVAIYVIETTVPQYEATARINVNVNQSTNIGIESLIQQNDQYGETDQALATQVQIMRSKTVAMDALEALNLYRKPPFSEVFEKHPYNGHLTAEQRDSLIAVFQGGTQVSIVPNTGLVDVSFQSSDPVVASNAANALVDAYMRRDLEARFQGTTRISDWLAQQLTGLKKQVESNQKALGDYVQKHNIVPTGNEGTNLDTDSLGIVNQQLAEAKADRIVKEARYKMALTRNPELLVSVAPGTILSSLRQNQGELMVQEAQLKAKFGPEYPKVRELNQQLASVQSDIETEITNLTKRFAEEYNTAQSTEALMQSRLDALKQTAYQENQSAAQFDILKHNAEAAAELYDALELKLQEAGITAGLNSNNVDIIDRATVPMSPVLPNKRSDMMFGLLGGLVFGLILAFVLESMDDTLRTSEETESISQLPTLAVVPHFELKKDAALVRREGGTKLLPDIVSYLDAQSIGAESLRTLRSAILLSAVDSAPQVLLITSSLAEEGKSTIAANLAISFAQREEKVLLVDTDLRRGTTHLKFGLRNRSGLSTVLAGESGPETYEHPLHDLPRLAVLSRGPIAPNPGEMLSSHAMEDLLVQWRKNYDRIILDSSPILAVSDSLALAPQVDRVLILVRSGSTRKKALLRTREFLWRAGARITGTVVNDVDLRLENYYTYSKGYAYGYKSNYGAGYGASNGKK
ncbi:MAG TPA: polysaccharide biosynthesis tyrosine autokinase [Silvibacterium sp.]|nr:polysaccharide biosynthesis tyrosine autokinase [Silvibacterium sp.]